MITLKNRASLPILTALFLFGSGLVISSAAESHTTPPPKTGCEENNGKEHDWYLKSFQNASWNTDGYRNYECHLCDSHYHQEIPAHVHNDETLGEWKVVYNATCTEEGLEERSCIYGDYSISRGIAPTHSWDAGKVTTAPTCTQTGVRTYTCSKCGETKTESIPMADHKPVKIAEQAPTCTEPGLSNGEKCSECGKILSAQKTISPLGHQWDVGKVTTEPSCTQDGVKTFSCSRCNETRTETIEKTAHTPVKMEGKEATCEHTGLTEGEKCSVCGKILKDQQLIPMTAHTVEALQRKEATCTEDGCTEGEKCSVCGKILKEQTVIPAIGHDWDEGVVTKEAEGFNAGEKTYTCKHDSTHVYTEKINPVTQLFAKLRNNPTVPEDYGPMRIVMQPFGSEIYRQGEDSTYELFVEVEGGLEPFTYEWHRKNYVFDTFDSSMDRAAQEFLKGKEKNYAEFRDYVRTQWNSAFGAVTESLPPEKLTPLEETPKHEFVGIPVTMKMEDADFQFSNLFDEVVATGDSAFYTADRGNCKYYCVIKDAAGNEITSDYAVILYRMIVKEQPRPVNLQSKEPARVSVKDGSAPYRYQWYYLEENQEMQFISGAEEAEYLPTEEYLGRKIGCHITDSYMYEINTNEVEVYSETPLSVKSVKQNPEKDEEREISIAAMITGGTKPYSGKWYLDGKFVGDADQTPAENGVDTIVSLNTKDFGDFTLIVTDEKGAQVSCVSTVKYKQLRILEQPKDMMLPYVKTSEDQPDPSVTATIIMYEGTNPFTYTLERDDGVKRTQWKNHFTISTPGRYTILATDREGRWARTDAFCVSANDLKISVDSEAYEIDGSQKDLYGNLYVQVKTKATGGKRFTDNKHKTGYEYLLYQYVIGSGEWIPVSWVENQKHMNQIESNWSESASDPIIYSPGTYCIGVQDAGGAVNYTTFDVKYTAKEPFIICQPSDVLVDYDEQSVLRNLYCYAESQAGEEDRYSGNHPMHYSWMKQIGSDGEWIPAGEGPALTVKPGDYQETGIYRCIVTDTVTGQSKSSDIARVGIKLELISVEQVDHKDHADLEIKIRGGKPAFYLPSLYGREPWYAYEYANDLETMKRSYVILNERDALATIVVRRIDVTNPNKKKYPLSKDLLRYYITLTDELGQTLEFTLDCHHKMDGNTAIY